MRKLFLIVSLLVALSLTGCASVPGALSMVSDLSRGASSASQTQAAAPVAQATAVPPASNQAPASAANVPAGIADLQNALANLYETVSPSVVNINVLMSATGSEFALPNVPGHEGLPELPDMPGGFGGAGLGSGFVWDDQGHIVTNNHVVEGASRISVTFSDGLTLPAEVVGRDPQSDLAVIKVDPADVDNLRPVAVADSTKVRVGEFVIALGNPFGLEGSMTFGIVSALGRTLPVGSGMLPSGGAYTIPDIIQTDAPVNPGNSGGALIDMSGRLIGVPTAIESPTRSSAGIGFAVPSVIVLKVVPELIKSGEFQHPYIGIRGGTLSSAVAEAMNLPPSTRGALVVEVTPDSPASRAGLRGSTETTTIDGLDAQVGGDVITAVDGQPVRDFEDLTTYLARTGRVGQDVNLTILRNGNIQSVTVTLAARPEETEITQAPQPETAPDVQPAPMPGGVFLGVTGMTVTPDIAQAMDLGDQQGVLVVEVSPNSPAERAGLEGSDEPVSLNNEQLMVGGDVIIAVDGQPIIAVEELVAAVRAKQGGDTLELTIIRDGQEQTVTATLANRGTAPVTPESQATPDAQPTPDTQTTPESQATPQAGGSTGRPAAGSPWLGINGVSVTAEIAQFLRLGDERGVLVMNVVEGSPAEQAGLKGAGVGMGQGRFINADVIVAVNGAPVATMEELVSEIQRAQVGDTLNLTVFRGGEREEVPVTLAARPAQ
jgi:S1-C subfamily serine protease